MAAGLVIFAWLSLLVHKANEAVRKQVSLKSDFRKPACIALAVGLAAHVPAVMLLLRSEHLWQRFILLTPTPGPPVRSCLLHLVYCFSFAGVNLMALLLLHLN